MGVHVSFLVVNHVQNQECLLITEKYTHMGICALVTCILFLQELYKPLRTLRGSYSASESELSESSSVSALINI